MEKFIAFLVQNGEGCDYTIGCGRNVIDVPGENITEALDNLKKIVKESYTGDSQLEKATIYQVSSATELNLERIYFNIDQEKKDKAKQAEIEKDNAEFERLKKKLGK